MRKPLFVTLLTFSVAASAYAQKVKTFMGDACTGVVVSTNEATREITINYPDLKTKQPQTFVGVLIDGYKQKLRDGSSRELKVSELTPDMRVRVFFKEKTENVGGQKVKVATIHRIVFLGRDQYTILREALDLEPSVPVTLVNSDKLPPGDPLKLYVGIREPYIKERLMKWVGQWNKEQGAKYGQIEVVPELAKSDVAAVFFWGHDESLAILPIMMYDPTGNEYDIFPATVQLVTKDDAGLKVLWLKQTMESRKKIEGAQGGIERELEKRMKARGKK
jgi:hypothetical protein